MDQLFEKVTELKDLISILHHDTDPALIAYLNGEIQHLINRIRSNHLLTDDELQETWSREHMLSIFKQFYTYLLITDNLPQSN